MKGLTPCGATDVGWAHGTMVNGDRQKIMCRYCQKTILGGGISRLKQHLAGERGNIVPCEKVPDDVKALIQQHLGFKVLEKLKRQKECQDFKTSLKKSRYEKNNDVFDDKRFARTHTHRRAKEVHAESCSKRLQNVVSSEVPNFIFSSQESIEQADIAVAKFLYIAGIPFTSVNSSYFQQMADAIAAVGPGYKMPSYYSLRGKLLDKCMTEVGDLCKEIRRSWEVTGCTIMVDRWIDKIGRAIISFFVYSPKGNVFLKSVEALEYENSPEALLSLFDSTIQEVGPRNVVAFLTDISPCHRSAAKAMMNKYSSFFSCVCANHCVDLMLNVIAEIDAVKEVLAKVKKICQLIYNNVWILSFLRKKTNGSELFQPAVTKFVTMFSILQNMISLKDPLQQVFVSTSWRRSVLSIQKLGSEVSDILLDTQFWSSCFRIMKIVKPLIEVIHLVDGEERPSMGYFYDAVEKARKGITLAIEIEESDYTPYLDAIDRIRQEIHSPLHAAAYYLNPSVYYSSGFSMSNVIQKGLLDCIETLEANILSQDNITKQKSLYEDAVGDFSRPVALRGRESVSPVTKMVLVSSYLVVTLWIRLP
ncbi:hypothetical protein AXF42_Ash010454 [Apostasia shenzhenica]|uniref:BED-type domain-containing protein n=1 Tax=Apostasia shenzhenica TaxID=1088818 RepID=A0A2I0BE14_9ASPA|nr:hypothetical protein AXF42_Ash010454 [Apostasia shenzhenica]